jgi:hypothetical protein
LKKVPPIIYACRVAGPITRCLVISIWHFVVLDMSMVYRPVEICAGQAFRHGKVTSICMIR